MFTSQTLLPKVFSLNLANFENGVRVSLIEGIMAPNIQILVSSSRGDLLTHSLMCISIMNMVLPSSFFVVNGATNM